MPMDDNGTIRMNMDDSSQIMMSLMGQLDRTLRSFESQLRDLTVTVKGFNKDFTNTNRTSFSSNKVINNNFNDWNRQFGKEAFKELDKIFAQRIKNIGEDVSKEQKEIDVLYKDFKQKAKMQLEWANKNAQESYEKNKSNANNRREEKEAERKYWQDKKNNRIEYYKLLEEEKKEIAEKKRNIASRGEDRIARQTQLNSIYQKNAGTLSRATDWNNSSSYLSMRTLFSDQNKTEKQQLEEIRDEQLDLLRSAKTALEQFIKNNKDLTDEDRELFKKQLAQYDKDIKIREDWTYTGEVFAKAGKDLATAGKNIINNLGRNIVKTVEDKYLSSYKEGFQNVYNSIETTRNTVSARLKLDQGGYSALQEEIQAEIQAQGLESTVSQVDVNNAIAELSAAGVTDKEMLKTLALEQAKLAASGSSLNLGNEETLSQIRQFVSNQISQGATQEEAIKALQETFSSAAGLESLYVGQGWTSAFVNGGMNTFYNATMGRANLGKWSSSQTSADLRASAAIGDALANLGIDPQTSNAILNKLVNSSVGELDTYLQAIEVAGIANREQILSGNTPEQIQLNILNSFRDMLNQFSGGDTTYLPEILRSLGMSDINTEDAIKLLNSNLEVFVKSAEDVSAAVGNENYALQNAKYLSETEKHQKKTENAMTDLAKNAQKQYKGNEYVLAGFDAVEQGIDALAEIGQNILSTLVSDGVKGLFGSGAGAAAGSALGGAASVGAGAAGAGAAGAGAAGVGAAGVALAAAAGVVSFMATKKLIGDKIQEGIESDMSFFVSDFERIENQMSNASDALLDAATAQLDAANQQLESLENKDESEKRLELIESGKIKADEALALSQEEVNKAFEEYLLLDAKQKKQEAEKEFAKRSLEQAKISGLANVQGDIDSGRILSEKEIIARFGGVESFSEISDFVTDYRKTNEGASIGEGLEALFEGSDMSDETKVAISKAIGDRLRRQNSYDEANALFRKQWSLAADKAGPGANIADIMITYSSMFMGESSGKKTKVPAVKKSDGDFVLVDGVPVLDDAGGLFYEDNYLNKFKTGLTNVPYDNYPAMLHKGERILTASEAEAYNEMSSYAISNLVNQSKNYGNSSNIFNTTSYGVSGFESSIDKQTNSLSEILRQILAVLKTLSIGTSTGTMSAAHRNVLRRNSSVSQINTLS